MLCFLHIFSNSGLTDVEITETSQPFLDSPLASSNVETSEPVRPLKLRTPNKTFKGLFSKLSYTRNGNFPSNFEANDLRFSSHCSLV